MTSQIRITEKERAKVDLQLEKGLSAAASSYHVDAILASWDGEADTQNPYNWSQSKKWFTTILTSLGGLVTLMSGAMLAPALTVMSNDLHISEAEASMALSIYVLAFTFGPMVLASCSEIWGRKPIWIGGGAWYVLWNTICGISNNRGAMITARLMAGLGASAEFAVSGPIVSDIWAADERGKSMAIRGFLPLLGPAIGPILGGVMVQQLNWRWLFYVMSIFDAIIVMLFLFFLPETHAQTLLATKSKKLHRENGQVHHADNKSIPLYLCARLRLALIRPVRMLIYQPALQLCSLVMGLQFGFLYIVLSSFSTLWIDRYKQSATASGLHYLAIVTGYIVALLAGGWATDRIWARLKAKNKGELRPEYRIPMLIPGVILIPAGLLWYGWSAERRLHWIMPDIGISVFGCGYIIGTSAMQAYIVDTFQDYMGFVDFYRVFETASAGAASMLPRNIFAFAFPVFAPVLYSSLDYGVGNTLLAVIAAVFTIPVPFIFIKYGKQLRMMGRD